MEPSGRNWSQPVANGHFVLPVQKTGAGTLRAFVTVDFIPGGPTTYCYPYLPPRVDVYITPRR
jgi:hypothetical protein